MKLLHSLTVFSLIGLVGCAQEGNQQGGIVNTGQLPVADCVFPNQTVAPNWICNEPIPGIELQAVGISERSPAGMAYMKTMAKTDALGNLAEQFKIKVAKMVKQYIGTTGMGDAQTIDAAASSTIKTITSQTLAGAKIYRSRIGPEGRMFVMIGLNESKMKALVKNAVNTSIKNEKALWQEFKAQKSFDEMAAGIAEMAAE